MLSSTFVHIGVATTDLERALRFWRDLLGLEMIETRGKLVILSDGLHNITVFETRVTNKKASESIGLHIGVRVDDLAKALQGCLDLGLEITCDDIDSCRPFDPANPPRESFKAQDVDGIVVDFTASRSQWLGVSV